MKEIKMFMGFKILKKQHMIQSWYLLLMDQTYGIHHSFRLWFEIRKLLQNNHVIQNNKLLWEAW